ncbi:hypothetical protein Sango_2746200 [Sesamum angolense]|uniref:Reverse transcriptase domain-containing protein n=1 Tax=Sesamum angolense TaxID=2727404 RepID=A0AAE1W075_9LAMI|nr:hypothetical protein Sango_2746200 [Sesamum angolense]
MSTITDAHGTKHTNIHGIQSVIMEHFHTLFWSSNPSPHVIDETLSVLEPKVSSEMNDALLLPFTSNEVHRAFQQMYSYKSPGPNDMSPIFFSTIRAYFRPRRGILQGDLLSPYLFLFYVEVFSRMVHHEEARGVLQGVAVSRNGPKVSHLLFADDTLNVIQAKREALLCIQGLLQLFEGASGLAIN